MPLRYRLIRSSTPSKTSLGSGVRPDPSLLTKEGQGLVTTVHVMMGGATSLFIVEPYDDTSRIWSIRDTSGVGPKAFHSGFDDD